MCSSKLYITFRSVLTSTLVSLSACCNTIEVKYGNINIGYGRSKITFDSRARMFQKATGNVNGYPHYTSEDGKWAIAITQMRCGKKWIIQPANRR